MNMTKQNIRNRTIPSIYLLLFYAATGDLMLPRLAAAQAATSQRTTQSHITILRDVSASMQKDSRHKTAGEVLKIAAALLDCQITVIEFASQAKSASFAIPADRDALYRFVSQATLGKSTAYLRALENIPSNSTAAIFLSDGEPNESKEDVLYYLKKNVTCPLHAVSISAEAEEVLREMAASTGGSFYRARDARELIDAFLKILSQVTSLKIYESSDKPITLPSFSGNLLCIGINVEPQIHTQGQHMAFRSPRRRQDVFRLPNTNVHIIREFLDTPNDISVELRAGAPNQPHHLVVATTGGAKLNLILERSDDGRIVARARDAGGELTTDNKPVDSRFSLVGEDGQVRQVVQGKRIGSELVAELDIPKEGAYDVSVQAVDSENATQVSSLSVSDSSSLPLAPSTATSPPDSIRHTDPPQSIFSGTSVDLRIVAHRSTGPVVLAQ